jgi:uncharacterized membrane protein|tara:strand:+ start:52 stop:510 length:459 start_codon:yes stop_codon:yes gene_type:complete
MLLDILRLFLWSMSPLGEAKIAIPHAIETSEIQIFWIFIIGLTGNLLVFPFFHKLIEFSNKHFKNNPLYIKMVRYFSKRAKTKTKDIIQKYGVWGLMIFVMIPIPVTGAYIGTIAAYVFRISYRKSLTAISCGIVLSSIIVIFGWPLFISLF